jgi:hypothetical protein
MSVPFRPKERKLNLHPTVLNVKGDCMLNEAAHHEDGWWSGGIGPGILNLGAGWN